MLNKPEKEDHATNDADVIVIGGGAAGPGAALFLARFGFDVMVFDKGKSAIRQCAFLGNYPGFPGGISVRKFLDFVHAQLEENGCELRRETVEEVRRGPDESLEVLTDGSSTPYRSDRVIVATTYDHEYLKGLPEEDRDEFFDSEGEYRWDREFPDGTTGVEGLYIAGRSAGTDHQVVAGAGHGASVGLQIIKESFRERGFWPAIADYVDWVVYHGRYETEHFEKNVQDALLETVPDDIELSEREIQQMIEEEIRQRKDRQMSKEEARQRDREAQMKLIEALDDDVVEEYVETHYATSSSGELKSAQDPN